MFIPAWFGNTSSHVIGTFFPWYVVLSTYIYGMGTIYTWYAYLPCMSLVLSLYTNGKGTICAGIDTFCTWYCYYLCMVLVLSVHGMGVAIVLLGGVPDFVGTITDYTSYCLKQLFVPLYLIRRI